MISAAGEAAIVQWEGEVLHTYDDFDSAHRPFMPGMRARGTLTIGVGHTGPDASPGRTITQAQSRTFLRQDLADAERTVESLVKVQLNDNQFATLVSFVYNVGAGNFKSSTLLKKLNAGDYDAVPSELAKWTKSKGKTMGGLVNRRAQEAALWSKGGYVSSAAVDVAKDRPNWVTTESVGTATGAIGAIGGLSGLGSGNGPVQIALAIIMVAGFGIAIYFFLFKRMVQK